MNVAERIIGLLEENSIETIFGIPGEQIMPLYQSLQKSDIKHILVRHEQAAAHACDGYYRSSGKFSVCVSTASPGALNLVMAVATAFKDNIPMLVITGDNVVENKFNDYFQSFPLNEVFKPITFKSYDPLTGSEAISNLKEALFLLENNPQGPIHINLSKDILLEEKYNEQNPNFKIDFEHKNYLVDSKRLFFIVGAGAISEADLINEIATKNNIPIATTFSSKGIIDENNKVNLGLIGNRGSKKSKYAFENSDCIIALGTRLSERTVKEIDSRIIQVNINPGHLVCENCINSSASLFLNNLEFGNYRNWLDEILEVKEDVEIDGVDDESLPLRPPSAISTILSNFKDNIVVSDAGSHTTWTTLLKRSDRFGKLLFSGGLAPMGYGIPAAIGASIANRNEKVVLINGDGDFQMNIQELATIKQYDLDIIMFVLNNSEYGIIHQTQKNVYNMDPYEVHLENPDFIELANSYGINSIRLNSKKELDDFCKKQSVKGPFVVEVPIAYEDIPMP